MPSCCPIGASNSVDVLTRFKDAAKDMWEGMHQQAANGRRGNEVTDETRPIRKGTHAKQKS